MNKLPVVIISTLLCVAFSQCSPSGTATDDKRYEDYTATAMLFEQHTVDDIALSIDREQEAHPNDVERMNISGVYPDELQLNMFYQNGYARKLQFSLFGDDGKRSGDVGAFYFDENGRLIIEKMGQHPSEDFLRFNTFTGEIKAFQKFQGRFFELPMDNESRLTRIALTSRYVATYMQFFPALKFTNIRPLSTNKTPGMVTYDSIALKSVPGARGSTLETLPYNTQLVYLGTNGKSDTVDSKYWIWYRVATPTGREGWVFGHPTYVNDLNEEAAEPTSPPADSTGNN
ncbi:MAG: SH3 domain-containing protein [Sphingobacteriales bacterium]|nr:MAG: SH3 domain-containing protein [Sphingobacteriales bacterium]